MTSELNVAVAQVPADLGGPQARLDWLTEALVAKRVNQPVDLLILPELFQSGYNVGTLVSDLAEPCDGPFASSVALLAKAHGTAILYGYAERQGETLFNSAQCIDKSGRVIGHHRKLILPPGFEGEHFAPGKACELFVLGGFKVAVLICFDVEFPENLRHVALSGADLVVVPTALGAQWGVVADKVVPARAFENGVFLTYANYCGEENGVGFYGGSCIIAPDGAELARAGAAPGFLNAQIEKSAVKAAQERLPYLTDRLYLPWVG